MKSLTSLILSATAVIFALPAFAEVNVALGDISDKRTTGQFFAGLEINLKLSGPELAEAKGIRTTVKDATDDTGKALKKTENRFGGDGFEELQKAFGMGFNRGEKKADEFQVKLDFENPTRAAKTIKTLNGTIELLVPAKDPAAVIIAGVAKDGGKPLENATLKAAGVEFTLRQPGKEEKKDSGFGFGGSLGANDLGYVIKDPKGKVASVEFFDAAGKKLESNGRMSSGFNDSKTVTVSFNAKPPADAVAKIYVVTEKSVVTVPIALKDIALP
jgi:hypothetical protein